MLILTNENTVLNLNEIGKELKEMVHFGVFDFQDKHNCDYFFKPLVMTETFSNVTLQFQIGPHKILLPQEWSAILADPETGDIEIIPIDEINGRNFHIFSHNPLKSGIHKFFSIEPVDVFADVSWTVPKISSHNFLIMPLENKDNPDCIFLINEKDQKKIPQLDINLFI